MSASWPDRTCLEDFDLSEITMLATGDISDESDGSPQPSDTEDPVSQHGSGIELSDKEDVWTLDAPEDSWLQE